MSSDHAYQARHDDDVNVLCLAADFIDEATAAEYHEDIPFDAVRERRALHAAAAKDRRYRERSIGNKQPCRSFLSSIAPIVTMREEEIVVAQTFLTEGDFLHIDVADGIFTFHKTWNDTDGWAALQIAVSVRSSSDGGASRGMDRSVACGGSKAVHCPCRSHRPGFVPDIAAQCKAHDAELMLSSNPETPPKISRPISMRFRNFQVLCVNPGLAGQKFLPLTLEKVKWLKYAIAACYN